jgi:NADH dehydrogenase (ubiquinone) 1 beta subcomplex subunit 3
MGGEHHTEKIHIPDWKQYKVDGIKHLEWTRTKLADKGLKDPWLRNEVWRYQNWRGFGGEALANVARGFKWALGAMIITIAVDQVLGISKAKRAAHHGGGHDEHH